MRLEKSIALFVILLLPLFAQAQCRTYGPVYSQPVYSPPTYVERVVIKEVAVPVVVSQPYVVGVPVVSYLYQGGYFQPAMPAVPAYPGVAQVPQQSAQVNSAAASNSGELSDAALDRLIDRIEKRLQQRQQQAEPRRTRDENPLPPPVRGSGRADSASRALAILQTNCASCHTGDRAKGGMVIFTAPGVLNARVNKLKVWDAADTGRMPPAAQQDPHAALTDEDVDELNRWRRTG